MHSSRCSLCSFYTCEKVERPSDQTSQTSPPYSALSISKKVSRHWVQETWATVGPCGLLGLWLGRMQLDKEISDSLCNHHEQSTNQLEKHPTDHRGLILCRSRVHRSIHYRQGTDMDSKTDLQNQLPVHMKRTVRYTGHIYILRQHSRLGDY